MIGKVEDVVEYIRLGAYCFGRQGYSNTKNTEYVDRNSPFDNPDCRLGLYDELPSKEGKKEMVLTSSLIMIPFVVKSSRQIFKCLGIRGVVTRPEYRNKGQIRILFNEVFRQMREKQIPISNLYPFKQMYYEKFGYVLCEEICTLKFDPADLTNLRKFPDSKNLRIREVYGEKIHEDIRKVYYKCCEKFDYCLLERSEWGWKEMTMNNQIFQFVCYDVSDENEWKSVGYIIWHLELNLDQWFTRMCGVTREDICPGVRGSVFVIREMNWFSTPVKIELFRFLSKHREQLRTCRMMLPLGEDISFYFGTRESVQRKIEPKTQTRIVLLQEVLDRITVSEFHLAMEVSIRVVDEFCPWNSGIWRLTSQRGGKEVKAVHLKEMRSEKYDLELDIKWLTMIVLGVRSIDEILNSLPVKVLGSQQAVLSLRCYEKRLYNFFNDLF